jgi:P-type conjugative transfer protein TrbJ
MIRIHALSRGRRLAIAFAAMPLVMGPMLASPADAQWMVFDPTNYTQNVLTAARELQQINNQIQQIENQTQSLINQAKNLASLPYSLLSTITSQIQRTEQLITQAQKIAYSVSSIDQAFTTNYGAINLNLSQQQMVAQAQQRWQTSVAGLQDAMRMQATVVGNITTARSNVTTLGSSSQSASGALQATQVSNQLLIQISQQLSDLIALEAADGRAQAMIAASKATNQNQGATQMQTFLTPGAGYQPGAVQMFHGN